jgi:hypothetical protein
MRCGTRVGAVGEYFCPVWAQGPTQVVSYRNFAMLCAALIDQRMKPEYSSLLTNPTPPGVNNLKIWIEEAWKSGKYLHESMQAHAFNILCQALTLKAQKG